MKLATALSERADLQRRISELSVRLNNNAKVEYYKYDEILARRARSRLRIRPRCLQSWTIA